MIVRSCKGQFIVIAAMFIATIILAMSLLIYSAGSRFQTLRKEPTREIVQTLTVDFKRILALALRNNFNETALNNTLSNWVKNVTCYYSGLGLQLKVKDTSLSITRSTVFLKASANSTLDINITSLGFYGYEYPAKVGLTAKIFSAKASLDGARQNYTLTDLNITLQAFKEKGLPASDLVITGVDIIMHYYLYNDMITLGNLKGQKEFKGNNVNLTLYVSNMDIIIVHVMTRDGVTVSSVTDNTTSNYVRACANSGPPSVETWYLLNPQNGVHKITVRMNGATQDGGVACAFSLKNVKITSPIGTTQIRDGSSKDASVSINTESDNSWIISIIGAQDSVDIKSNQDEIWSFRSTGGDKYASEGTYMLALIHGSYTQSWTFNKAVRWAAVSVEVKGSGVEKETSPEEIDIADSFNIIYVSKEGIYKIVLKKDFVTSLSTSEALVFKYEIEVTFVDSNGIQGSFTFEFPYP